MNKEVKEILNEIGYHQHIHEHLTLNPKELDILKDHITSLEQKLETEHKAFMGTVQELTETATRIDKALKCIDENAWFCYKDNEEVIDRVAAEELINILKGSDK